MINTFKKKLIMNVMLSYIFLALLSISIAAYFSFTYSSRALKSQEFNKLLALQEIRKEQIQAFFQEKVKNIKSLSMLNFTTNILTVLNGRFNDAVKAGYSGRRILDYKPYKEVYDQYYIDIEKFASLFDFYDLFFFSTERGNLIFSLQLEEDFGTPLNKVSTHLSRAWLRLNQEKKVVVTDIDLYSPSGNKPAIFVLAPVIINGKYIGAVGGQLTSDAINRIMHERIGLGRSGQKFLVGEDKLLRAQSRGQDTDIKKRKFDSLFVDFAAGQKQGTVITTDDEGHQVMSIYSHLGMRQIEGVDFEWAIVVQKELKESLSPVIQLGKRIALVGIILFAAAALFAFFLSHNIASPIRQIAQYVLKIANKDISSDFELKRKRSDEIGTLCEAVTCMARNLREQIGAITEGINVLAGSSSEISAAISQYASNSTQIATAISETAVSIRELKQTSELANEKAAFVADITREVMQTSQKGRESVESTTTAMQAIREQMTSIAESIVSLNEKTKSINDIIAVVEDIADESRLLAVNAAIEAVKAGEYGKGFSVVASEIRSLAEQSKKSTGQVRNLLTSIQEAASAAVMATEKGDKVVENGMRQASLSGESIIVLSRSISDSSQAAIQIETTGKQQLAGIAQVFEAIESIDTAVAQNTSGAEQLKRSTLDLEELGKRLQKLVENYRL